MPPSWRKKEGGCPRPQRPARCRGLPTLTGPRVARTLKTNPAATRDDRATTVTLAGL